MIYFGEFFLYILANMDKKSMWSSNTIMTMENHHHNQLHQFFHLLMAEYEHEFFGLGRIVFLQLVLRENVLLYGHNRTDPRLLWLYLAPKLGLPKPYICVLDAHTSREQLLKPSHSLLLYDLHQMSNSLINELVNHTQHDVSFLGVQDPEQALSPHVCDLFPISFVYSEWEEEAKSVDSGEKVKKEDFPQAQFEQWIKLNFQVAVEGEQQPFLKPYLSLLQDRLAEAKISTPHGRWKKMLQILKFIGNTRVENTFKKMSLSEMLFVPNFLAESYQQLNQIKDINDKVWLELVGYYGWSKVAKAISSHFWLPPNPKHQYLQQIQTQQSHISFYYPCCKYPQTVEISGLPQLSYKIQGHDKKLMSDHHYPINPEQVYHLHAEVKASDKVTVHVGIGCYDQHKNIIQPVQVCRKPQSEVLFTERVGNVLKIKHIEGSESAWNTIGTVGYEQCIGIYPQGNIDEVPAANYVIECADAYGQHGAYKQITQDCILLSQKAEEWISDHQHLLLPHKTILMNHYQSGSYCIGHSFNPEQDLDDWNEVNVEFNGVEWNNTGHTFFPSTHYIRILFMLNYNSGHPHYHIHNPNAQVQIRNIRWETL